MFSYEEDEQVEEPRLKMELISTWDEKERILVCKSDIILNSTDYAHALREFANSLEDTASLEFTIVS